MRDVEAAAAGRRAGTRGRGWSRRRYGCGARPSSRPRAAAEHARAGRRARRAAPGRARSRKYSVIGYSSRRADRAAAVAGDVADQPDREPAAAFGALLPVRAHARRPASMPASATHFAAGQQHRVAQHRKRQRGAVAFEHDSARLRRQQRLQELHLRQAQRAQRPVRGFDRLEHAVQQHHAGHERTAGEMPGQAGMVGGNRRTAWRSGHPASAKHERRAQALAAGRRGRGRSSAQQRRARTPGPSRAIAAGSRGSCGSGPGNARLR